MSRNRKQVVAVAGGPYHDGDGVTGVYRGTGQGVPWSETVADQRKTLDGYAERNNLTIDQWITVRAESSSARYPQFPEVDVWAKNIADGLSEGDICLIAGKLPLTARWGDATAPEIEIMGKQVDKTRRAWAIIREAAETKKFDLIVV